MSAALLDVNVLIALSDPLHLHHEAAHRWFAVRGRPSWATCSITENGFIRVASHPSYPNRPGDSPLVLDLLRQLCGSGGHQFWAADVSLRDGLEPGAIFTHAHVTDLSLLRLAVHHGGRLATFDQRLPVSAVRGGSAALELVPA